MKEMKLGREDIIGIDLGTTNCAVAVYSAGTVPTLLQVGKGQKYTVPSCVRWDGYNEKGEPIYTVGEDAYNQRYLPNAIYSVKRMMGSGSSITLTIRDKPPYPSAADNDWNDATELQLTPAEVSSIILSHLKDQVAKFYRPVTKCVITVPAYFNQRQINDTLEASRLAGLDCLQILKEPTSASYIYSQLGYADDGSVLIYDLGGGTFDVTHMHFLRKDSIPKKLFTSLKRQYGIDPETSGADVNDQYFCRVLGTYGDVHLGGDDIDKELGQLAIQKYNLQLSKEGEEKLYLRCESYKKSGIMAETFTIDGYSIELTEDMLVKAVDKIFNKTLDIMRDIDTSDTKTIVLVGGSTKSQRIRENLSRVFPDMEISAVLDPDATVALGAGSVAKAIANDSNLMYSDVLPLPIGILVDESKVDICIDRNTSMPYSATRRFYTLHDNQEQVTLHVYQGLSEKPAECTYLGRLTLKNIPEGEAGTVCIYVHFILDGQGRLRISSTINDVKRDEELVIDNIFDVTAERNVDAPAIPSESSTGSTDDAASQDEFELSFLSLIDGKPGAMELIAKRRELKKNGESLTEVEDSIVQLALGLEG